MRFHCALFAIALIGACSTPKPKLEPYSCGSVQRVHAFDEIYLASQPAADDFKLAKERGVRTVLNLRMPDELKDFDEPALVRELGMEYVSLPFQSPDSLTPKLLDSGRALLRDASRHPLLVHCHSANRVGAIWLAYRVMDGGLDYASALAEAKEVGLKSAPLEEKVKQYLRANHAAVN